MKPEPAQNLSKEAKRLWRQMQEEYEIVDGQGILLLNTMFEAHDQAQKALKILENEGYVIENDTTGHKRAHPAASILKEARLTYLKALQMLNLDIEPPGPIGRPPGS